MKFVLLIVSVAVGNLLAKNPLLLGMKPRDPFLNYLIIDTDQFLDDELFGLSSALRPDFEAYRNHCLRVATFTKFFLPEYVESEIPNAMELVTTALAYHDIALWTDKALSYLEPSVAQMEKALTGSSYSTKELAIMKEMILQHHKWYDFESDLGKAADALVNAFRKADWADATMGVIRFGMPDSLLQAAYDKIPEAGFHKLLAGLPSKLAPDITGMLQILKIFKL